MKILGLALCICLLPIALYAQQVKVQSGEHPQFTRLVFAFQERIDWTLRQGENRARLEFTDATVEPDFSSVFQRVPKTRLTDIAIDQSGQIIDLLFGCFCSVNAFWFGDAFLVVDIKDKPPETTVNLGLPEPSESSEVEDKTALKPLITLRSEPKKDKGRSLAASLTLDGLESLTDRQENPVFSLNQENTETRLSDLTSSRQHLVQQLGRAATQGLLNPKAKPKTQTKKADDKIGNVESRDEDTQSKEKAERKTKQDTPEKKDPKTHINIQTSVDRDFLSSLVQDSVDILENHCLDTNYVDVTNWGSDEPFWTQVSPLRATLTNEFDVTNEESAVELARKYIFFGFGAEALQVLALSGSQTVELQVLTELAMIMEHGEGSAQSELAGQIDCGAPLSLWSTLSYRDIPKDVSLDIDAIMLSFSALPLHLRSFFGPILSRKFLRAGMQSESEAVLRILSRNQETESPNSEMASADIDFANGETARAAESYQSVLESNTMLSAEALIRKIEAHISNGEAVSFDLAQLAGAYAYESALQEDAEPLARIHVLALGASGAFEAAYVELQSFEENFPSSAFDLRPLLAELLLTHYDQIQFLEFYFAGELGDVNLLDQPVALEVSRHLVDMGFYKQASDVLTRNFEGAYSRRAKVLRAKAAIHLGLPRRAEVEILGLDGKDVNVLRAKARSLLGQHKQAYELFSSVGMTDEADRQAWLASEARGAEQEHSVLSDDEGNSQVLEQNRALASSATSTIESLEALLNNNPMPQNE